MLLACIVLLTLMMAIAAKLSDQPKDGFFDMPPGIPVDAVTSEIAATTYNTDGVVLTGSYDQKTNNPLHTDPRTSNIMERELINPQVET